MQVATVAHHGKYSAAGHYTADVKQPDGRWLHFDDGTVSVRSTFQVHLQCSLNMQVTSLLECFDCRDGFQSFEMVLPPMTAFHEQMSNITPENIPLIESRQHAVFSVLLPLVAI